MATSYPVPLSARSAALSPATAREGGVLLSSVPVGVSARVLGLGIDGAGAAWLRAVGIDEGEVLVVLRRAPFGGPLHVRTAAGGEFALNRELAHHIRLVVESEHLPPEPA